MQHSYQSCTYNRLQKQMFGPCHICRPGRGIVTLSDGCLMSILRSVPGNTAVEIMAAAYSRCSNQLIGYGSVAVR